MPTPASLIRKRARPALLLSLLALACDPTTPPTTPELPQVSLTVLEPSTVGTSLKLSISVSGCDAVQRLELHEGTNRLKSVTYSSNPVPVELAKNEIPYTRGIAASLSLTAHVTCGDGRTNVSQPQPATFFPVEEVVEPASADAQVVPDIFVVDGSGSNAAFIGCEKDSNGRSWLVRVPRSNPQNRQRVEMAIPCTVRTVITERKPAVTGWRWVWTPDEGYFAIDPQLQVSGLRRNKVTGLEVDMVDLLVVGPDGHALAWDVGAGGTPKTLRRVSPQGVTQWQLAGGHPDSYRDIPGFLIGLPVIRGDGNLVVPLKHGLPGSEASILVGKLSYATGDWVANPVLIDTLPHFNDPAPPVAFDATGSVLYIARQGTSTAYVRACAFDGSGETRCDMAPNRRWLTDLQGNMAALVPYANGARVAAIGPHHMWLLDAANGQVKNKDNRALSPEGALVARFALPGPGNVFYLLTSAAPSHSQPYPLPVEILATDAAERGELFRYQVPGGSLFGAVDDTNALWLRVGRKLVKPMTPEQYRLARGN
jgi:hypothetical protein